jgi:GAF domain-containing protein
VAARAAFPVRAPDGQILGTFCVMDTGARDWTPHDLQVLETVSHATAGEIALRTAVTDAKEATHQATLANALAHLFGVDRLCGILAAAPPTAIASDLAAGIETAVLDYSGRCIADDTAMLVLRVPPPA